MTSARPRHLARPLPGGLHLRGMSGADLDELDAFVTRVFGMVLDEPGPDLMAGIWARELLRGDHPTTRPEDGAVVVDTRTGRIVACCFLISQMWRYEGVPFAVGRPELIASDPDYRGMGLIREVMSSIHTQSAALGHAMQALTGIPFYYRQYGYEPALISEGSRRGPIGAIPDLASNEIELVHFRPAQESDIPFITRMHERAADRAMIAAVRDYSIWRHELLVRDPNGDYWHEIRIIEDSAGNAIGCFAYVAQLRGETIVCTLAELIDDSEWAVVAPALLHWLRNEGEAIAERNGGRCEEIEFDWTPAHPLLDVAGELLPARSGSFAWYVRIDEIGEFIRLIAPVLEGRLATSDIAGYSGEVTITFHPNGLRIGFDEGRLTIAELLPNAPHRSADAAIPGLTFLQLLLGSRTLEELKRAFPFETYVRTERAHALLNTLFPKASSAVWPVA